MISHLTPKFLVATVAFILTSGLATQERAAHADVLTCDQIGLVTTQFNDQVRAVLEERVAGEEIRLSYFKTLRIDGIAEVYADGCEATVVAQVTLKRRILPDVHGTVTVSAHVTAETLGPTTFSLRFDNIRVTDIELRHIGEFREWLFKILANRVLPDSESITIEL